MKRRRPSTPFKPRKRQVTSGQYNRPAVSYVPRKRTTYVEYKATDASWANIYNATAAPQSITANLVRGDAGLDNFEGNKIFPVGLELRLNILSNTSTATPVMNVRVMIFQWFDSTTPTLSGVLQNTGVGVTTISPKLMTNRDNIRVLMDKKYCLNNLYPAGSGAQSGIIVKKFIKGFKMSDITMASGSNVPQKGDIYIAFMSDTTTNNDTPTFYATTRLTFTD